MEGKTFILGVLSGGQKAYIRVDVANTWTEAQSHCREKYNDLASVSNEEELIQLVEVAKTFHYSFWIGLYDDVSSWRWSLEKEGYYDDGEAEFRKWRHGEPNNIGGHQNCVRMDSNGVWADLPCKDMHAFVCYNDMESSSSFIFVNKAMGWTEAQSYCRTHHTDLASVRNQEENDHIQKIAQERDIWIGLYRDSWKWSDGSPDSFPNWKDDKPNDPKESCAFLREGKWEGKTCDAELFFLCSLVKAKQQVVKLKVTKKDPSVDLEDAAEDILEQFSHTLKDHGLTEDTTLTWRKQPDGRIFYLEKRDERKEKKKLRCSTK